MGLGRLHACLALATLALARSAAAAEGEPVRVEVRAPAECADDARFFAEMQARTSHVRLVGSGEAAGHTLRVRVERRGKGFEGELVVVDATGASTRRALSAESCDVVVSGLAWVAARAIDPDASFAPRRSVDVVAPEPVPAAPMAPLFPCAPVPVLEPPPAGLSHLDLLEDNGNSTISALRLIPTNGGPTRADLAALLGPETDDATKTVAI